MIRARIPHLLVSVRIGLLCEITDRSLWVKNLTGENPRYTSGLHFEACSAPWCRAKDLYRSVARAIGAARPNKRFHCDEVRDRQDHQREWLNSVPAG